MAIFIRLLSFSLMWFAVTSGFSTEAQGSSGQIGKETGYWNIYASYPGGENWFYDRMGTKPASRRIYKQSDGIIASLKRCGIPASRGWSNLFSGFAPDLVVVIEGPVRSKGAAASQLARARQCGVAGYTRYADFIPPQPGED